MTVSNVLNRRQGRASPTTINRVMEAVARLGYIPNAPARALSAENSNLIAMVYPPAPYGAPALTNTHDAIFISEVERRVREAGLHLLVHAADNVASAAASLLGWGVDGAIFLDTLGEEVRTIRERHDRPIVFVDNYSRSSTVHNVGIDDHHGGWLAGDHLAQAGHRRIGFVGPQHEQHGVVRQRYLGFVEALTQHGLRLDPRDIVSCNSTFEDGIAIATHLATTPDRPTAYFATADMIAVGMLKGLTASGIAVPGQVSLVGFDDLPICRQLEPELTTIQQDIPAKAHATVELLLRLVASGPRALTERSELHVTLVERATVTSPAATTLPPLAQS
jgi:LacI family transcriptional regulator